MAHTCPECGSLCHCNGDIDDIDFGDWIGCSCGCADDDDDPEDFDYGDCEDYY